MSSMQKADDPYRTTSFFAISQRYIDILCYQYVQTILIEQIIVKSIHAWIVVAYNFLNGKFPFKQHDSGDQTHMISGVLDQVFYQLLSECFVLMKPEGIAFKGFQKLLKLIRHNNVSDLIIQLVVKDK